MHQLRAVMRRTHGLRKRADEWAELLHARQDPSDELGQRLSSRALLEVFARVALTVAFAHERGFVHRALKPDKRSPR